MANTSSYLLPPEIPTYYDKRRLLALVADNDVAYPEADLSDENSELYDKLTIMIRAVSAVIDSRCQVGRRYSRSKLELMAQTARGDFGAPTEEQLKRFAVLNRLTADLLWGDIVSRRGFGADKVRELAPRFDDALAILEQLYNGIAIFDIDENLDASVPSIVDIGLRTVRGSQFNRMLGLWPDANLDQPHNPYSLYGFGYWGY